MSRNNGEVSRQQQRPTNNSNNGIGKGNNTVNSPPLPPPSKPTGSQEGGRRFLRAVNSRVRAPKARGIQRREASSLFFFQCFFLRIRGWGIIRSFCRGPWLSSAIVVPSASPKWLFFLRTHGWLVSESTPPRNCIFYVARTINRNVTKYSRALLRRPVGFANGYFSRVFDRRACSPVSSQWSCRNASVLFPDVRLLLRTLG